jgi:hypothetical protein
MAASAKSAGAAARKAVLGYVMASPKGLNRVGHRLESAEERCSRDRECSGLLISLRVRVAMRDCDAAAILSVGSQDKRMRPAVMRFLGSVRPANDIENRERNLAGAAHGDDVVGRSGSLYVDTTKSWHMQTPAHTYRTGVTSSDGS